MLDYGCAGLLSLDPRFLPRSWDSGVILDRVAGLIQDRKHDSTSVRGQEGRLVDCENGG